MYLRDKLLYEIDILNERSRYDRRNSYKRDMIELLKKYSWNAEMLYIIARKLKYVDVRYIQQLLLNTKSAKYLYLFALEGYKCSDYKLITRVICSTQDVEYMFKTAKYIRQSDYNIIINKLAKMKRFDVIKLLEVNMPILKRNRLINKMVEYYTKKLNIKKVQPAFDVGREDCILNKIL